MHDRILLMLALAAATVAGCQKDAQPISTTVPSTSVAATSPVEPPESPDEEGLRAFVTRTVVDANARLAGIESITSVECMDFRRCRYLIPSTSPSNVTDFDMGWQDPPAGAVRQAWTDRYALAQQYKARYDLVEIGRIMKGDEGSALTARVVVSVSETSQRGLAKDESVLPPVGQGLEPWRPRHLHSRVVRDAYRRGLPTPELPRQPDANAGKLVAQAKDAMEAARPTSSKRTVTFRAKWLPQKRLWYFDDGTIDKNTSFVPDWRKLEDLVTPRELDALLFSEDTRNRKP